MQEPLTLRAMLGWRGPQGQGGALAIMSSLLLILFQGAQATGGSREGT